MSGEDTGGRSLPAEIVVRGQSFVLKANNDTTQYAGRFSEHVTGYVVLHPSIGWKPALVEFNPFQKKNFLDPSLEMTATAEEGLEAIFKKAEEIETRYAHVKRQHAEGTPLSRYDGVTPYEASIEAQYDQLVRSERRPFYFIGAIAIVLVIGWIVFG